jgi:hypothetical protein
MEQNPAGTGPGEQTPDLELPDFIDKGTTQSYKETLCAAVLLRAARRRPPGASPAPKLFRYVKGAALLLAAIYGSARYDPELIRHFLSLK